jgi:hypothetical protein
VIATGLEIQYADPPTKAEYGFARKTGAGAAPERRSLLAILVLILFCGAMVACSGEATTDATASKEAVGEPKAEAVASAKVSPSLNCDGGTFSKVRLRNTRSRSYEPGGFAAGQRCELTDQAAGVIWVVTGEGLALADAEKKLVFKDDQGRQFGHTCWTTSGTINGVTQTEAILFGPEDSRRITVCCGESCAGAEIE